VEPDISILTGGVPALRIRQHLFHPPHDAEHHIGVRGIALGGESVEIGLGELGVVVRHLLEVGDDPLGVDAVAVEAPSQVVVHPTATHPAQGVERHRPPRVAAQVGVAGQEEGDRSGVRELGAVPPAAEPRLVMLLEQGLGAEEERLVGIGGGKLVERLADDLGDRRGLRGHPLALVVPDLPERGASGEGLRRVVGPAEEDLALRSEECREGPAADAGEGLDRPLVPGVDVGALVAVDLDADEAVAEEVGDGRVLVRLAIHHVAPMAPDRPDVEQDRTVEPGRLGERLRAPRPPLHRLVRGGSEVG
jgi:hypothetical protein